MDVILLCVLSLSLFGNFVRVICWENSLFWFLFISFMVIKLLDVQIGSTIFMDLSLHRFCVNVVLERRII